MQVPYILKNKWVQLTSVAVAAFAGGSVGGYILGKNKVYRQVAEIEAQKNSQLSLFDDTGIKDTREQYEKSEKDPELEALLDQEEAIAEERRQQELTALENYRQFNKENQDEPAVVNVFRSEDDDWDYEAELSSRKSNQPYVLHEDEFINDEMGYKQETLTYYAGDDIMADPADTPVYNHAELMGELKFGHGTRDKSIVYIRNEKMEMEWEILLHTGMYSTEVRGLEMDKAEEEELRHSIRSVQKFRQD